MNEENSISPEEENRVSVNDDSKGIAEISSENAGELTGALESTLESLNQSIEYMETIVRKLEAGDSDWEESVRMLAEANELAMESSQKLDRVVQDVVYGSAEDEQEQDPIPGI
ncbi:MAG: exodeoxyribonuclease VII small subunit [Thermoleophilia bacterium]